MRQIAIALSGLLLSAAGCSCEDLVVHPEQTCDLRTNCGDLKTFRHGACVPERCASDGDCCAGERCGAGGKCGPVEDRCSSDQDCTEPGFFCIEEEGRERCRRPRCASAADCALGSCFEQRCVIDPPCREGCDKGSFCDVRSGKCLVAPPGAEGCEQTCGDGQRLMLADPQSMRGAVCCLAACECRDLPDISPRDIGLHLDAVALGDRIAVAAYERHFGDLVYMEVGTNGTPESLQFVDGFPEDGAVEGRADGPRGGSTEPGVDAGRFPSLVLVDGEPQVAYQRADDGALVYAWRANGQWTRVAVDSGPGTGYEPDLKLDAQGRPHIAYRTRQRDGRTELRYAIADRAKPDHPASFHKLTVVSSPTCVDGCGAGQVCVQSPEGERCMTESEGCASCAGGTVCVGTQEPECLAVAHRSGEVLERTLGHSPQLLLRPDGAVIVFGDRQQGQLRVAEVMGGRTVGVFTLDGGDAEDHVTGRVGRAQAAAFDDAGQLVVFYRDEVSQAIRRYRGPSDGTGHREVIDDGRHASDEPGGLDRAQGVDLSLVVNGSDQFAVFQDQSMGDVSAWMNGERRLIRSQLLDGFSARLVWVAGRPYAVHGGVRTDRDGVARFGVVVVALQ